MKLLQLLLALILSTSVAFAQKKEVREIEKALKTGSYVEAKAAVQDAEALLSEMDDKLKIKFYLAKGNAFLAGGAVENTDDIKKAATAFKKAFELTGGKGSEANDAENGMINTRNAIASIAFKDIENANNATNPEAKKQFYKNASEKFYAGYELQSKDTIYLFNAAITSIQAEEVDQALDYFTTLKDLGYTGISERYIVTNKETAEIEEVASEAMGKSMILSGDYVKLDKRKTESKRGEIIKNVALILISQGKDDEAIAAIEDAKKAFPNDPTLISSEANIYLRTGQKEKYRAAISKLLQMEPDNFELYFNLGATAQEDGDNEMAVDMYKKVLEINPDYYGANINMAVALLKKDDAYVEEMNSLGNSKADNQRYDELKEKRKALYIEVLPYALKAHNIKESNQDLIRMIAGMYSYLGEFEKEKAMKAKLDN
ncbi:MAG: hypothetical protein RQ756_02635 [Flavobacteriaceae bacterium]|nr:hypothetical protein [Flavobacteriaceae bacterium]